MRIGYDWIAFFYPAVWLFLTGGDPYGPLQPHLPDRYFNPPWLLPLLVPFGLLPVDWGAWAINAFSLAGVFAFCIKHKRPWLTLPIVMSYPMADLLYHGSVDGFSIWGLVIGGPVGIFLLSIKPQVAGLVGLLWSIDAYRAGGWTAVTRLLAPTAVIALVFTALYPHWIATALSARGFPGAASANLFPWLLPLGLMLAIQGMRRQRDDWAVLGTNLLSPYLRAHSWVAAMVTVGVRYPRLTWLLSPLSWLLLVYLAWTRWGGLP